MLNSSSWWFDDNVADLEHAYWVMNMPAEHLLPRYTVEDYLRWHGDWELWGGYAIAMSPSPFGRHQAIVMELAVALRAGIQSNKCGARILHELDWIVDPSTVVRPDLIAICGNVPERHLEVRPDLIAEILSDSTRENDLNFKYQLYQAQGVSTYLIVDPSVNELVCHRLKDGTYESTRHRDSLLLTICGACELSINVPALFEV